MGLWLVANRGVPSPSQEFGSQNSIAAPPGHTFGVHIHLVEGVRLAVRDRGGGWQ